MKYNPQFCLDESISAENVWRLINQGRDWHTLFLQDERGRITGSITDGDIRRGLLNGFSLEDVASSFANPNFFFVSQGLQDYQSFRAAAQKGVLRVPVTDLEGCYAGHYETQETHCLLPAEVLIVAGGKGTRMGALTQHTPKPLLPVLGKPILGRIIDALIVYGIKKIHIALHHEADMLEQFVVEWVRGRVPFEVIREDNPLGTAGALSLVNAQQPWLFMMNADILTDLDLEAMYLQAIQTKAEAIIAASGWKVEVPYAVLESDGQGELKSIQEKPIIRFPVNAGIYLFRSELRQTIPNSIQIDMPDVLKGWLNSKIKVHVFDWSGSWQDLGSPDEYYAAQGNL
jgi:dTDP-glucose pyrophosphorylase